MFILDAMTGGIKEYDDHQGMWIIIDEMLIKGLPPERTCRTLGVKLPRAIRARLAHG